MATVICTKTGWPQRRSFHRGYRLQEDACHVCDAPLRRPAAINGRAGTSDPSVGRSPTFCPAHDCWPLNIVGIDTGTVEHHVLQWTHYAPPPVVRHYCDMRHYRCPQCGEEWAVNENPTEEEGE